jgi:hypothetical protein
MDDLISRQAAIDAIEKMNIPEDMCVFEILSHIEVEIATLPPAQPEKRTQERTETHACDCISRQAAINAVNKLIDRFEQILRDIRETNEDESVCGMCEYDGAFIGQSGDWCNECPGFDKADCFKLSDRCRKRWLKELNLPAIQPERKSESVGCGGCKYDWFGDSRCNRCARSFQDHYEADMRGEQDG